MKYFDILFDMIPVIFEYPERDNMGFHDPKFVELIKVVEPLLNSTTEIELELIPNPAPFGDDSTDILNVNQNANGGQNDRKTGIEFHHPTVLTTLAVITVLVLVAALVYAFAKIKSLKHRLAMAEHEARRNIGAPVHLGAVPMRGQQNPAAQRNIYNQPV